MSTKLETSRFKFETTAIIKRALQLRAFLDEADLQDVVNAALSAYLADQIGEVVSRGMVRKVSGSKEEPGAFQ